MLAACQSRTLLWGVEQDRRTQEDAVSTRVNGDKTALLVVDVQIDVMANAFERDKVIAAVAATVDKARKDGVPVVWVQHSDEQMALGSDGWRIVPELDVRGEDARVDKRYGDSFEATDLEQVLDALHVGTLVVAGAQTDACIRSTIHGALARGYDTILVSDAHTTEDLSAWGAPTPDLVIRHTNMYWEYQNVPGRRAGVVTSEELDFLAVASSVG